MDMDWVFFADDIYDLLNSTIFVIFNTIYSDYSVGVKSVMNVLFHLFIVFYALLAIRSGIVSSIFSIARTIVLLLITFNLSFNISSFKTWVFKIIIDGPTEVARYFVSSTICSFIPDFSPLETFDTSDLFCSLTNILLARAQQTHSGMISLPSIEGFYLYFIILLVVILYFAFWIIYLNFLIQVSVFLIIGIPVMVLVSFRETQAIFFEWLRAVATLMLCPIIASIIIFIILNIVTPLHSDIKNILNTSQIALSASGTLFSALVFGIYALRQVPSMAAVLTRGALTTGNPIDFTRNAASTAASAFSKATNAIGSTAGSLAAYNKSPTSSSTKSGSPPFSSGNPYPVIDTKNNSIQSIPGPNGGGVSPPANPSGGVVSPPSNPPAPSPSRGGVVAGVSPPANPSGGVVSPSSNPPAPAPSPSRGGVVAGVSPPANPSGGSVSDPQRGGFGGGVSSSGVPISSNDRTANISNSYQSISSSVSGDNISTNQGNSIVRSDQNNHLLGGTKNFSDVSSSNESSFTNHSANDHFSSSPTVVQDIDNIGGNQVSNNQTQRLPDNSIQFLQSTLTVSQVSGNNQSSDTFNSNTVNHSNQSVKSVKPESKTDLSYKHHSNNPLNEPDHGKKYEPKIYTKD